MEESRLLAIASALMLNSFMLNSCYAFDEGRECGYRYLIFRAASVDHVDTLSPSILPKNASSDLCRLTVDVSCDVNTKQAGEVKQTIVPRGDRKTSLSIDRETSLSTRITP